MERVEQPVTGVSSSVATLDFAPKKLAWQLDFTPVFRAPVQKLPAYPPPVQPVHRVAHPVASPALSSASKPESPRPQLQAADGEIKDVTPKKQKQCNCKNSRCLKSYCECLASGIYCDGCSCINCHNNVENEAARQEAVGATLERKPNAFRPKIANSQRGSRVARSWVGARTGKHKGCNCKKGCLEKYCVCFQANILCSDNCKCFDCKNFEGSEERRAVLHGSNNNIMIYQAANAAINGAIGSSCFGNSPASRKGRSEELSFVVMYSNQSFYHNAQHIQGNQVKPATSSLPLEPTSRVKSQAVSKLTYRSPLAGVIQPQNVRELCFLLVVVSKEAAMTFSDKNKGIENNEEKKKVKTSNDITSEQVDAQKELDVSADDQAVGTCTDCSELDESDLQHVRPASPGTMAVMCYEQDTLPREGESPRKPTGDSENVTPESSLQDITESFVEQERMVLTKFRDFLNRLIAVRIAGPDPVLTCGPDLPH